jgi:hypothetical protein
MGKLAVLRERRDGFFGRLLDRHPGRDAANTSGSMFIGLKRASRLRFWAVAARRNSSLAPFGPQRRKRVRRRIRLRWASSIPTFFRRRQASTCCGVAACARATSRASSCRSRGVLRARAFGQHYGLSLQVSQSNLLARQSLVPRPWRRFWEWRRCVGIGQALCPPGQV